MTTLTCLRGFPASGKTTYARQLATELGAVVLGRDFLREMLFNDFVPGRDAEDVVTIAEVNIARSMLKSGQSVIIDNCNVNPLYLKQFAKLASECGADFDVKNVKTPADVCVTRDAERAGRGERSVGAAVIEKMALRYPIAKWPYVEAKPPLVVEPVEHVRYAPDAFIIDIDGTLARIPEGGRSPYDYTRVFDDLPYDPLVNTVQRLAYSHPVPHIIIMSGRDDTCREDTKRWLLEHEIPFDQLLMRPVTHVDKRGNKSPDFMVKHDLFNQYVRGKYNVQGVFDDRLQVVELWYALGLPIYRVGDPHASF